MPIFIPKAKDPFCAAPTTSAANGAAANNLSILPEKLPMVYLRVLKALFPRRPDWGPIEWPIITRLQLAITIGWSPIGGTLNKALNGIGPNSKSTDKKHPGVIGYKLVEAIEYNIDGVTEVNYRITRAGIEAWQSYVMENGSDELPPLRDPARCTRPELRKPQTEE